MTVSWVATASNSTVESSARIVLFDSAPHSAATSRTASKIRSGHPLARSLWRHSVNTLASKPPSSMPSPAAAFQRTSQRSRSSASRSEHPSSACRTITTAITDPGTDGRPRGPKRSSNNPSGNNLRRLSAKNRCTDPSRTRPPHKPKVSNSSRSSFSVPCIPHDPTPHTRSRAPRPELLSTLLGVPFRRVFFFSAEPCFWPPATASSTVPPPAGRRGRRIRSAVRMSWPVNVAKSFGTKSSKSLRSPTAERSCETTSAINCLYCFFCLLSKRFVSIPRCSGPSALRTSSSSGPKSNESTASNGHVPENSGAESLGALDVIHMPFRKMWTRVGCPSDASSGLQRIMGDYIDG